MEFDTLEKCRICEYKLNSPVYISSSPSITSVREVINADLAVYLCPKCNHLQKPTFSYIDQYYQNDYRISLQSEEFDQLYDVKGDRKIFRTEYQAGLVNRLANPPMNSKVLDFGAGKASTLKNLLDLRQDIKPFVYDVSSDYKPAWDTFIKQENQATYTIPSSWKEQFALVTAHFVFEHIGNIKEVLFQITNLLLEKGKLFFTVPNVTANFGDLLAIDHINHFCISSIQTMLNKVGLAVTYIDQESFRGSYTVIAQKKSHVKDSFFLIKNLDEVSKIVSFWNRFNSIIEQSIKNYSNDSIAIFGAGVYGSFIATKILNKTNCKCFLDNNPHLSGTKHMGLPIFTPDTMTDDISIIYAGLNPVIARDILEPLRNKNIKSIIYFD